MTAPWPTSGAVAMVQRTEEEEAEIAFCTSPTGTPLVITWWAFANDECRRVTQVHSARPLVTLDPKSGEDCTRLAMAIWGMQSSSACGAAADILRALAPDTTPPRPAEPTGLGVRVVDRAGIYWAPDGAGSWWPLAVIDMPGHTWDELLDSRGPVTIEGGESDDALD